MAKQDVDEWFVSEVLSLEPRLTQFLRQNWRDPSEVADLRQDVYVRVYEAAAKGFPTHVPSFVMMTARNLMIDRVRRSRIVSMDTIADLESLNVWADEVSSERRVVAREELRLLQQALDTVPSRARETIVLRRIEGLSQREAAARMGIAEATVERHLRDGLRFLAEALLDTEITLGRAGAAVRARKRGRSEGR
ncbi:MAG TPA: RNA polymerase sigma factor [Gemmatimonadales bacterium]|nr:RNA polymerase sigma factor [Gemmatimonadales bacterium]